MKRLVMILIFSAILISACAPAGVTSGADAYGNMDGYTIVCIDGVEYIQKSVVGGFGYLAPHFSRNSVVYTCER
jgi:hypothetical protein